MSSHSAPGSLTSPSEGKVPGEDRPDAPPSREPSPAPGDAPLGPGRYNVLLLSFLSFFLICFGVWVVSAGKRYREEYAQVTEGWRVGTTRSVELTLMREDNRNLGCVADNVIEGLHCGHQQHETGSLSPEDPQTLKPYNTVGSELLLGAGLWGSPALKEPLPEARFTVFCNYHIKGVMKGVLVRFDLAAPFSPIGKTVTAGTLTDCALLR